MGIKIISDNRKAAFKFHFLEKIEAGLVLTGSEVKSLRAGRVNLGDAYAVLKGEELFLINCHISPYPPAAGQNHEPLRTRKLLLHRNQIERLIGKLREKGLTLVPTKLYFKEGRAKVELAVAKGKKLFDKRETIKKRQANIEMGRAYKAKK